MERLYVKGMAGCDRLWGKWILQTKLSQIWIKLVIRGLVERWRVRGATHWKGKSWLAMLVMLVGWFRWYWSLLGTLLHEASILDLGGLLNWSVGEWVHGERIIQDWLTRPSLIIKIVLATLMWSWRLRLLLLEVEIGVSSWASWVVVRMIITWRRGWIHAAVILILVWKDFLVHAPELK